MGVEPPVPDPLAALPETARRIVETTRRLMLEHGYGYLSLENISNECQLNKTAIRYYFGNKAGLMELVVDSWIHDNARMLSPLFEAPEGEVLADRQLLRTFLLAKAEMSENTEMYLAFFELLPAILRDARHSDRIEEMYEWAIDKYGRLFASSLPELDDAERRAFVRLVISVVDGLGVQHAISRERYDAEPVYEMLASLLAAWTSRRM